MYFPSISEVPGEVEVIETLQGDPECTAFSVPGEPDANVEICRIAGSGPLPQEIGRDQRRLSDGVEPVLDATIRQVDAVQRLIGEFEEGVDLVAMWAWAMQAGTRSRSGASRGESDVRIALFLGKRRSWESALNPPT